MYTKENYERLISALSDDDLVREYDIIQDIDEHTEWVESILVEVIDLVWDCLKYECTKRYVDRVKNESSDRGLLVAFSRT